MRQRQRQHQRPEHLRLARTGRTDQETVRTHAVLRRFLDVEHDGHALRSDRERHPESVTALTSAPLDIRIEVADITQSEEIHEIGRAFRIRAASNCVTSVEELFLAPRGEASSYGLSLIDRHLIRNGDDWFVVEEEDFHASTTLAGSCGMEQHPERRK